MAPAVPRPYRRRVPLTTPEIVSLPPQDAVCVRGVVSYEELPDYFSEAFAEAAEAASRSGVEVVGPPFGFYPEMPASRVTVEAGFPVSAPASPTGRAHPLVLPGGDVVRATHVGPYDTMAESYEQLRSWVTERDLHLATPMWECCLSDPDAVPDPSQWRTQICWPLAPVPDSP